MILCSAQSQDKKPERLFSSLELNSFRQAHFAPKMEVKLKANQFKLFHTDQINNPAHNRNYFLQYKDRLAWNESPDIRNPYNVYRPVDGLMLGGLGLILELIQGDAPGAP